jgi:thiamine pyrophosphate-dependent acetolactate synthase large subunit-like protein
MQWSMPRLEADWVSIASGFGMAAARCETAESFDTVFARSMTETGPSFIEAVIE